MESVLLKAFNHHHEAELAQGLLKEAGIKSMISSNVAGDYPQLSVGFGNIHLLVLKSDLDKAKKVIEVLN